MLDSVQSKHFRRENPLKTGIARSVKWITRRAFQLDPIVTTTTCNEGGCQYTTNRRSHLWRHTDAKHRKGPPEFPCPVGSCKHHGDKAFARQDKPWDHVRKNSQWKDHAAPGQAMRPLQAALPASTVQGLASSKNLNAGGTSSKENR